MLALNWDNSVGAARLSRDENGALRTDFSLETPVLISIFTDVQASAQEIKSAGLDRQQGWWADADSLRATGVRKMGSKLWLLSRGKTTRETCKRVEQYVKESLQWLIDDGIVASVAVTATKAASGILNLSVSLYKPNKLIAPFQRLWQVEHDAFL